MLLSRTATGLLVCSLLCTGCAKSVVPNIEAKHYPQCVRPFEELQAAEKGAQKKAAAGGLVGVATGLSIGLADGNIAKGIGLALALGAVGAIGGYSFAAIDQSMEEEKRFAAIRATADANLGSYNRFQMYCYESMLCYLNEFDNLQNSYRAGSITKTEYTERFKEIRAAMVVLGKSINSVEDTLKKVDGEFVAMMDKAGTKKARKPAVTKVRKAKNTRTLVRTIKNNNKALVKEQNRLTKLADASAKADGAKLKKQGMQTISSDYDSRFVATNSQLESLRIANEQALSIMDSAALEAGIETI